MATYPDVSRTGMHAFEHYCAFGVAEGRNPNALFDTAGYALQYGARDTSALDHYLRSGATSGCNPNAWFDSAWYLETNPDVCSAGANPLEHYLTAGAREGRDPHPLFSSCWYVSQEAGATGMNPLEHFVRWGEKEGASPHPLFDPDWYTAQHPDAGDGALTPLNHYLLHGNAGCVDPHPLFSTGWYLDRNPDVASADMNALEHYLRHGARDGRDPHPLFSSRWYLEQNSDVAAAGLIPLVHYVMVGARELRSPHPLFDPTFYVAQHRDHELACRAPLEHYITTGWRRGIKPHPDFDPAFYLREYRDVREAGTEPLTHFVTTGRNEGRRGLPPVKPPSEVLRAADALSPAIRADMRVGVTIGVPIYRGKAFLEESLASVRDQTFRDIDVIMSLDGPDHECEEICRRFLSDPRFRLVVQPERLGWMKHTNWLMSQVDTEFWHLQEQDDVLDPVFLERLIAHARENPQAAAVFGDVRTFGTMDTHMEMSSVIGAPLTRQMKVMYEHFPGVAPLGLVRTEALRLCGGLPHNEFENFAADTVLMAGLARWGELVRLPMELYRKRVHPTSTHASWWEWGMDKRFKAWQAHCLDMLQQALAVEGTAQDRRLLWLAVVERLVSPRTASYFLHVRELTPADRTNMLNSFLQRARNCSLDIPASLDASWEQIEDLARNFYQTDEI